MVPINSKMPTSGNAPEECKFRAEDVIVLLGAGASVEAGLLSSEGMMRQLSDNILSNEKKVARKWGKYNHLYRAVKSSILYGHHLVSSNACSETEMINIEELVNVLTELAKAEAHPIYPFIAAWNMELTKYGGADFANLKDFRRDIVNELVGSWVNVKNDEDCLYYKNFYRYWEETRNTLRIFSLNYDMCVERACGLGNVCRGFRPIKMDDGCIRKVWKDGQMDDEAADQLPIILYKLHGSIDWRREKMSRMLYCEDSPDPCSDIDDYQLIFGTTYKLSYQDPFLYQISELRKFSGRARLIIAIGYGFNDDHINEIIGKSMSQRDDVKLLSVDYIQDGTEGKVTARRDYIKKKLQSENMENSRVNVYADGAKTFLDKQFCRKYVESLLEDESAPF